MSWIRGSKLALVVVFGSAVFGLLVAEIVLRILFIMPTPLARYYPIAANVSGKPLLFDQYEYQTINNYNSYGFRDKEFKIQKSKPRILFFGDSFLEGQGVDEVDRFSNLACHRLHQKIECINFGQIATNPNNYFDNLIDFGVALQPDVIVVSVFLGNDFMQMGPNSLPDKYHIKSQDEVFAGVTRPKLYLFALINQLITKKKLLYKKADYSKINFWELITGVKIDRDFYLKNSSLDKATYEAAEKKINPKILQAIYEGKLGATFLGEALRSNTSIRKKKYYSESDYDSTLSYLLEMNKIAKNKGADFLIILIPDMSEVNRSEFESVLIKDFSITDWPERLDELGQMHNRLTSDLNRAKISYIDLTERLKVQNKLSYYKYDNHFNSNGHKVAGELLGIRLNEVVNGRTQ